MKLYEKVNYTANVNALISTFIREYDISKANINILYKYNVINKDQYNYFYNLDREKRQKEIGIMRKNREIEKILSDGIAKYRKKFFIANNIKDNEVLSIKNDAVYLINKIAKYTKFDNIEFKCKNIYTSFYKLFKLELYYFYDPVMSTEILDIKGINNNKLKKHENYFLEFLKVCFNSAQIETLKDTLDIVITFYNRYLKLELDINYYRQFDFESRFLLKPISKYNVYKAETLNDKDKVNIDIGYNLQLIRELYQIYSSIQIKNL